MWFEMRVSSAKNTRRYCARSGTSRSSSFSIASTIAVLHAQRRAVIEPVEIGQRLQVGLVLDQLLGAAVEQADMRIDALDDLAVELHDQAQHAVRRRMLRAEVDRVVADRPRRRWSRGWPSVACSCSLPSAIGVDLRAGRLRLAASARRPRSARSSARVGHGSCSRRLGWRSLAAFVRARLARLLGRLCRPARRRRSRRACRSSWASRPASSRSAASASVAARRRRAGRLGRRLLVARQHDIPRLPTGS